MSDGISILCDRRQEAGADAVEHTLTYGYALAGQTMPLRTA